MCVYMCVIYSRSVCLCRMQIIYMNVCGNYYFMFINLKMFSVKVCNGTQAEFQLLNAGKIEFHSLYPRSPQDIREIVSLMCFSSTWMDILAWVSSRYCRIHGQTCLLCSESFNKYNLLFYNEHQRSVVCNCLKVFIIS